MKTWSLVLRFLFVSNILFLGSAYAVDRAEKIDSNEDPTAQLTQFVQSGAADQAAALRRLEAVELATQNQPNPSTVDLEGASPASDLKGLWKDSAQKTLGEVFTLHEKLLEKWRDEQARLNLSDAEFKESYASKGMITVAESGLGVAELNVIDDQYVVRVVHEATEITFILGTGMNTTTPHFKQYIARQHIAAGRARNDHQEGRDVVVISKATEKLSDEDLYDPNNFERFNRAQSRMSFAYWKDYWNAIKKAPTKSTATFGAVCGLFQATLAFCVNGLQFALHPEKGFDFAPGLLSDGWGTGIGTFVSTYKNWTNLGSTLSRTVKSAVNSALFGYTLMAIHNHNVESLFILDAKGVLMHATVIGNVLANNLARTFWNDPSRVRDEIGISRKKFAFTLPWPFKKKRIQTDWQQSAVESQAIYLAPFTIRLLDYINFTVAGLPLGKILLWGTIPGVEYLSLRYLERVAARSTHPKAIEMAAEARKAWNLKVSTLIGDRNLLRLKKLWNIVFRNQERADDLSAQLEEFSASNLLSLRLQKIWNILIRNKEKVDEISKQLAEEYPQYFDYLPPEEKSFREAEIFEIPTPSYAPKNACEAAFQ